jgi:hypothetical protein
LPDLVSSARIRSVLPSFTKDKVVSVPEHTEYHSEYQLKDEARASVFRTKRF